MKSVVGFNPNKRDYSREPPAKKLARLRADSRRRTKLFAEFWSESQLRDARRFAKSHGLRGYAAQQVRERRA